MYAHDPKLFFSPQENTFQVVIATDGSCNSHFLFLYESMEWSDTNKIGYTNGAGMYSEYTGHNGDATSLNNRYVYTINPIIQAETQLNKGNMVIMQQSGKDGGDKVYTQQMELGPEKVVSRKQQEELRNEGVAMSQQSDKDGSMEVQKAIAILQNFVNKKSMQSKLIAALQEGSMKKAKA